MSDKTIYRSWHIGHDLLNLSLHKEFKQGYDTLLFRFAREKSKDYVLRARAGGACFII